MLRSIQHLFSYAWANLFAALGTTTLSISLFSFAIPLVIFVATVAIGWRGQRAAGKTMKEIIKGSILSWQTIIPSAIYVLAWTGLLSWSLAETIHKDHGALLERVRTLVGQTKNLQVKNDTLEDENNGLRLQLSKKPNETIKTVIQPASEEPLKVTLWNYWQKPKGNVVGEQNATDFVVIANKRLESPIKLLFDCDGQILFATAMVGNSGTMVAGWTQKDRQFLIQIDSPSVDRYVPIVVTIDTVAEVKAHQVQILAHD